MYRWFAYCLDLWTGRGQQLEQDCLDREYNAGINTQSSGASYYYFSGTSHFYHIDFNGNDIILAKRTMTNLFQLAGFRTRSRTDTGLPL